MTVTAESKMQALELNEANLLAPVPFGQRMRDEHFLFDHNYAAINHGAFGAHPKYVQARLESVQRQCVARPDIFYLYEYPALLDDSREALAEYLQVPSDEVVLVQNATVATNTVLRNLKFEPEDAILSFSTAYGSVTLTVESLKETTRVTAFQAKLTYPLPDGEVVEEFRALVKQCCDQGKKPRVAIFDTVSSLPGVYVPWERLVAICREEGILSFVDAAHGVGQIDIDIAGVQPDFLTSNLHKWLLVPRGCAVLYVAKRNQHLIRTTYPTSHGFVPLKADDDEAEHIDPLPKGKPKSEFVQLFEFVATADNSPYLCIEAALKFREEACGGDKAIKKYSCDLARKAAKLAAEIWETELMDTERAGQCALVNVRLPISITAQGAGKGEVPSREAENVKFWIQKVLVEEYNAYAALFVHGGQMWVRLSGQIYLEMADFERAIGMIAEVCGRVKDGIWKQNGA